MIRPAAAPRPAGADSLVPLRDRISDAQARLALARLLAAAPAGLAEAADMLRTVLAQEPNDSAARAELAGVLARQGRVAEARAELQRALAQRPDDPELLMLAADLEASLGHAKACRDLYERAMALLPAGDARHAAGLRLAAAANLWGDFNLTEAAYRQALARAPGDVEMSLTLAQTLVSAQRYEEAEALYRELLLDQPGLAAALAGLADLKYRASDYAAALAWCNRLLAHQPDYAQGLRLRAQALFKLRRYDDAASAFLYAARQLDRPTDLVVGLGRVRLAQGKEQSAKAVFAQAAQRAPDDPQARFWSTSPEKAGEAAHLERLTRAGATPPLALVAWGDLFADRGMRAQAIACYRAALAQDPDCFPAGMNLAEVLAADHQYQPALDELARLDRMLPGDRKVLLARARTLAWARAYDDSLAAYEQVHRLNPADPVPMMEAARTAAWAKQMPRAQELYAGLTQPPVDGRLAAELTDLAQQEAKADQARLRGLAKEAQGDGAYQGYERVQAALPQAGLSAPAQAQVRRVMARLAGAYRLQKTAVLESRAKALAWDKRFVAGLHVLEELVAFRPGNQEARFDLAQAQCALGLCDREKTTYAELLAIDPLHTLAGQALARQEVRSAPALRAGYSHWQEVGRGELSQMDRSRLDLGLEVPVFCRFNLRLTGHRWLESPRELGSSAEAFGPSLALDGQMTPRLKAGASWTHKDYQRADLADRDSGHLELWYHLADRISLGAGFTREDQLTNAFALAQGIQRDAWWLGFKSDLSRAWSLEGRAAWLRYSDDNQGVHHHLTLGRMFSDHPRIFKVSLRADYRDTDEVDQYRYLGPTLVDITHPYWSPQDNLAGALILEWQHDLSRQYFCGAPRHFYDLRLSLGSDTENNPAAALEARWLYEFAERWSTEARGLVHRSREWDAQGLWLYLVYRF